MRLIKHDDEAADGFYGARHVQRAQIIQLRGNAINYVLVYIYLHIQGGAKT